MRQASDGESVGVSRLASMAKFLLGERLKAVKAKSVFSCQERYTRVRESTPIRHVLVKSFGSSQHRTVCWSVALPSNPLPVPNRYGDMPVCLSTYVALDFHWLLLRTLRERVEGIKGPP